MTPSDAPSPTTPTITGFSVREFAGSARGSHRAELDLDSYSRAPLDAGTLDLVALLARLERGALGYLRSMLVTPTHADARVTAFLVTWAYEKFWVADALELVVAAHPAHVPARMPGVPRLRRAWYALDERLEPIRESVIANLIGEDVIAVHLLTGAVDEWITQAAYERLAATTTNPEFARTLAMLLDVKRRHSAFFADDARARLERSPDAARLVRRRLSRTRLPLGSRSEPPALVSKLFGDLIPVSQLDAIDVRLDGFPGLTGLDLMERVVRKARSAKTGRRA